MNLSNELVSEFVKMTNDSTLKNSKTSESIVYGTMASDGSDYVTLDGSSVPTPVVRTTDALAGERVMVLIKNHTATVIGNIDAPSARAKDVQDLEDKAASGEFGAAVLRIESSRGTVFKNNNVNTVLSAVIFKGPKRITDLAGLHEEFGSNAYLEWSWKQMDEDTFGTILSTDSRLGDNGFTFTLSPSDVNTKVTFMCQLITD